MSDQIREQEIRRRLVIFLRIPNETWTDILKLFPRRTLVQKISPICYRLKEICNRNVKNVHVITQADRFNEKLRRGDPEANQQLEHLAGNNCQLASQFRLTRIRIIQENMAILRHCIELFRGCRLSSYPIGYQTTALTAECLTHLEAAKPIAITINLYYLQLLNQFLRHPTTWECNRVTLLLSCRGVFDLMPIAVAFLDWLHHQPPIEVDDSGDGGAEQEQVRCLIIRCNIRQEVIEWLINGCIQTLQQSQGPEDRRRFLLSFSAWDRDETTRLDQFERQHNEMTGEVLLLERADVAPRARIYRLRRCLAEEAANGNEFYRKTFNRNGPWNADEFVVNDDGPMVGIY